MKVIDKPMYKSDSGQIYEKREDALKDDVMFYARRLISTFNHNKNDSVDINELIELLTSVSNCNAIIKLATAHELLEEVVTREDMEILCEEMSEDD